MKKLTGIGASAGIAIAKVYELTLPDLSYEQVEVTEAEEEIKRFIQATEKSIKDLEKIRAHTKEAIDAEHAEIFSAHILMLQDPEVIDAVKEKITEDKVNAEFALDQVANKFIEMFKAIDNEYMKERAADLKDITQRVMAHLLGRPLPDPSLIDQEVILVARDLTPSDTAQLNREFALGFVTDIGGRTSHSAIMARSLEIPAVVGTRKITDKVKNSDLLIVDGLAGEVIINPDEKTLLSYERKKSDFEKRRLEWARLKDEPTLTKDGVQVELAGNIGNPADLQAVLDNGGEAIGLYRTEFLYMDESSLPSEDKQFQAYKSVLEKMEGKPVVVRTLDIGGDKEVDYLSLPEEMNPFLGVRAIRYCLENEEIFRPQLRALLRASVYGNLKIMFPMVATLDEFRRARAILLEEKEDLVSEGVDVSEDIELGIMVEIPSTAIIADQFAKEVDFFSIGTNDLIQYTFAADRMNEELSYLYQPYHPAILRLLSSVIDAAHAEGKWVGMCGEMAGDELAIPILLGLGLDEFSMSASSILPARSLIRSLSQERMASLKDDLLAKGTSEEVLELVREFLPD